MTEEFTLFSDGSYEAKEGEGSRLIINNEGHSRILGPNSEQPLFCFDSQGRKLAA